MNNKDSYVYFIENLDNDTIKIGISKSPKRRLKQLQTGNSSKLRLIYTIGGCDKIYEKSLHQFFQSEKVSGEWFKSKCVLNWIRRHKLEVQYQKELGIIKQE